MAVGLGHQRRMSMAEAARLQLEEEKRTARPQGARARQLSALAAHLQRVTEDEKTRLARELHDELGAILTAIKLDRTGYACACRKPIPKRATRSRA